MSLGVNVYTRDEKGLTLLHLVADDNLDESESNLSWMELLLSNGADVNAQDVDGKTPLHWLVRKACSAKAVKLLLDFGADVNIRNNNFDIPLMSAIESTKSSVAVV